MTIKNLFKIPVLTALMLAGCTKNPEPPIVVDVPKPNPVEAKYGTLTLSTDYAGTLYTVRSITFDQTNGYTDSTMEAFAWFGNSTVSQNVGKVFFNENEVPLTPDSGGSSYTWYKGLVKYNVISEWNITGSNTFPAFSYADNNEFTDLQSYVGPPSATNGNKLSVTFATAAGSIAVLVSIFNKNEKLVRQTYHGKQTITFSADELSEMIKLGGELTLQIMPVAGRTDLVNGKNYFFIKQSAYVTKIPII